MLRRIANYTEKNRHDKNTYLVSIEHGTMKKHEEAEVGNFEGSPSASHGLTSPPASCMDKVDGDVVETMTQANIGREKIVSTVIVPRRQSPQGNCRRTTTKFDIRPHVDNTNNSNSNISRNESDDTDDVGAAATTGHDGSKRSETTDAISSSGDSSSKSSLGFRRKRAMLHEIMLHHDNEVLNVNFNDGDDDDDITEDPITCPGAVHVGGLHQTTITDGDQDGCNIRDDIERATSYSTHVHRSSSTSPAQNGLETLVTAHLVEDEDLFQRKHIEVVEATVVNLKKYVLGVACLVLVVGIAVTVGVVRGMSSTSNMASIPTNSTELDEDMAVLTNFLGFTPNVSSTKTIDVSRLGINGTIPTQLGLVIGLEYLALNDNFLSGPIPTEFGQLTHLTALGLFNNSISGPIPSQLALLTSLSYLYAYDNNLDGCIPTQFGLMTALRDLGLGSNMLTGPIPTTLGLMASLKLLDLANNQLDMSVPTSIGMLTSLSHLSLHNQSLSGTITSLMVQLTSLVYLSLAQNSIQGTIPSQLGMLSSLEYLVLFNNQLSADIPSHLGKLSSLKFMGLSSNNLSSTIPTDLGLLTSLEYLVLYNNSLTGHIPTELGQLTALSYLGLYNNHLSGSIPSEILQLDIQEMIASPGNPELNQTRNK